MKKDLFQSCGHWWVLKFCWHIECSTFTASSFRIWSSSTGILPPPLKLFIVMLPKGHLTSHSRLSCSSWVMASSWLSELWRSFLYSSSVYSCHLFLISFASVRSIPFLSLLCPCFHEMFPPVQFSSVAQSCPTLQQPHGLLHSRPPCPSSPSRVYSNSCPFSRWCHPTISSSVIPFFSLIQSFPASGSFQMSEFFTSGDQSIGVSDSTSVLPMNT